MFEREEEHEIWAPLGLKISILHSVAVERDNTPKGHTIWSDCGI